MKVYLVEVVIRTDETLKLEPIAIKTKWYEAHDILGNRAGLITEMILDKVYPERPWRQWAYGEEHNKDEEKCPVSGAANCAECSEGQIKDCSGGE